VKDDNAVLTDPYLLTKAKKTGPVNFTFPNSDGQQISLSDPAYEGKIKLVQIMGTWCPNCMDELNMIQEYMQSEKPDDIAVISIAFERYKEKEKALKVLKTYRDKTNMTNEILWGGYYDKKEALKQLPLLDTIMSYPTLLYVDQNNNIRKIYTGFSGPATPAYEKQKSEFKATINAIRHSQ
jgi:thiol-disulfide isomerase/thioredoxin